MNGPNPIHPVEAYPSEPVRLPPPSAGEILKHGLLLLVTVATTTVAGMIWQNEMDFANIAKGLPYSISLLFILSCHEFGHYFAARRHGVSTSLPWYIPFPPIPSFISFGTLGAVIRTRRQIPTKKALFDIGVAGPIAGFIASLAVLIWGFTHLPGQEFLLGIHPDYDFALHGSPQAEPGTILTFGTNLLYSFMSDIFAPAGAYVPPMTEMYHYPFLVTGWFGLLVTALNLLPAGQLDGGHIAYALLGRGQHWLGRLTFVVLFVLGTLGFLPSILGAIGMQEAAITLLLTYPWYYSVFWTGWLLWALIIVFVVKMEHPPIDDPAPLDETRVALGVFSLLMFILCFSPAPLFIH